MTRTWFSLVLALHGCGAAPSSPDAPQPGLTFPVKIAEGKPQAGKELPAASSAPLPEPRPADYAMLPDPEPLRLATQWEYQLVYDQGRVSVKSVRRLRFDHPVVTVRHVGRYAVELWIGRELIDRVRFDFPVIGAEAATTEPRRPLAEPPTLAAGAVVERTILVPASPRATRAVLVDRGTGVSQPLPWPPDAPLPLPSSAPPSSGRPAPVELPVAAPATSSR